MKKQIKITYQDFIEDNIIDLKTKTFDVEIQTGEELGQIVNYYMNTGIVEQTESKITIVPPCNIRKIEFDPRIEQSKIITPSNTGLREIGEASEKDIAESLGI